ncbi:ABC transporter ATP-binding protein [Anopheles sinensis]|uniref:ABC transporter ATP-binding protein n=1 Tax=Anopheles sinensis TaxID=74873 RepID=A0A084VEB4_ANOSI|nr:ABC transporter ATP-binding protein [Anopheles sinensis]
MRLHSLVRLNVTSCRSYLARICEGFSVLRLCFVCSTPACLPSFHPISQQTAPTRFPHIPGERPPNHPENEAFHHVNVVKTLTKTT